MQVEIFLFGITSHLTLHSSSKQLSVFQMPSFKVLRIIQVLTHTITSDKVCVRYYSLGMYLYLEYLLEIRSQSKSVTHTSTLQWDCLSGLILLLSHSPCGFIPTDNLN